jgi:hypothetical protein
MIFSPSTRISAWKVSEAVIRVPDLIIRVIINLSNRSLGAA